MQLKVRFDDRGLRQFSEAAKKQLPFAVAVALTKTAAQAKDAVQKDLPSEFIIRNRFTAGSIRSQRAEKRDWPRSKALVGSISAYMAIQEDGGIKTPLSKAFAIPKGIRTSDRRLVPRSKWPGQILQGNLPIPQGGRAKGAVKGSRGKPKPFLVKERDGVGVYVRVGKTRKLKRLYRLTRQEIHVRARHWLSKPTMRVVDANLRKNFETALAAAMKPRE